MTAPLDLLTCKEAADLLKVSEQLVLNHAKDGELPSINIGRGQKRRRIRFRRADLEAFIDMRRRVEVCQSISEKVKKNTRTISNTEVVDFQALRAKRKEQKQKRR